MEIEIASVTSLLEQGGNGPIWTHTSTDLNVNLIRFDEAGGVPSHVNDQLDVFIVAVAGEGFVEVDGYRYNLSAGQCCIIPKGARRSIGSRGSPFAYLTCHERRGGIWPS